MPFTLIHGLVSFLAITPFTKDKRFWLLAFWAGMMADLDGLPILWDLDLFYEIHHDLLHPLIYAIIFGLLFAFALSKFAEMDFSKTFAVFATGYALHPLTDTVFTNWPVPLFWPFSGEQYVWPMLVQYNGLLAFAAFALSFVILIKPVLEKNTGI